MYRLMLALALAAAPDATAQDPAVPRVPGQPDRILLLPDDLAPPGSRPPAPAAQRDAVLRWNEVALAAVKSARTPPPIAARNLAIVHLAVYDAVNAVDRTHRPYLDALTAPAGTDPTAAAAAAAHRTLVALYPDQAGRFDAALRDTLTTVPAGTGRDDGVTLGRDVADRALRLRAQDGDAMRGRYTPRATQGGWQPTPPAFRTPLLPGWATVTCLALPRVGDFRPPGPPDLMSEKFAAAYRRVKDLGAADGSTRTADQTEVARFWADGDGTVTPPGHWNHIAQTVSVARGLTLAENARLFAMLNVALSDAGRVCWDGKYGFDFWRPVTAIRVGGRPGDPAVPADRCWAPLLETPPFPSYPSGHSTFSGAAAAVLAEVFGTDEVRFASTSDGLPGVTRSFRSFSDAAREAGVSRIYGGIHWDFDNEDGLACGRKVGEYVARHFFRPASESSQTRR